MELKENMVLLDQAPATKKEAGTANRKLLFTAILKLAANSSDYNKKYCFSTLFRGQSICRYLITIICQSL